MLREVHPAWRGEDPRPVTQSAHARQLPEGARAAVQQGGARSELTAKRVTAAYSSAQTPRRHCGIQRPGGVRRARPRQSTSHDWRLTLRPVHYFERRAHARGASARRSSARRRSPLRPPRHAHRRISLADPPSLLECMPSSAPVALEHPGPGTGGSGLEPLWLRLYRRLRRGPRAAARTPLGHTEAAVAALEAAGLVCRSGQVVHATPAARYLERLWRQGPLAQQATETGLQLVPCRLLLRVDGSTAMSGTQ